MKARNEISLTSAIDAGIASIASVPDKAHWIVALSGGADSSALLHLLHERAVKTDQKLTALVVNHNLRPEAAAEAEAVAKRKRAFGIAVKVLTITAPPPKAARQEWARHHRYELLCAYARKKGGILWLAHHRDDQAETIAMRLARASGLQGLGGMKLRSDKNHVLCVRPFLSVPKSALITYCADAGIETISDPSNHNKAFERIRWRTLLSDDERLTDNLCQLGLTAQKMNAALTNKLTGIWREAIHLDNRNMALICDAKAFHEAPPLLQRRLAQQIISVIGSGGYPPSYEAIERFLAAITAQRPATLGGCQISYENGQIRFLPEAGRGHEPIVLQAGADMIYQGRLLVRTNVALILQPMTKARFDCYDKGNPYRKQLLEKSYATRMLFPYMHTLDDRPITPHIKDMVQKGCFQQLDWPTEQVAIYPLSRIATSLM